MQAAMARLAGRLRRRRRLVVGAWIAALIVAAPLSVAQTSHLTDGGFQTPGSDSYDANRSLQEDFGARQPLAFGVVLTRREGGTAAGLQRAVDDYARRAASVENVEVPRDEVRNARERARTARTVIFPLTAVGSPDESVDAAVDLRRELGVGDGPRDGVEPYLVGTNAAFAALHEQQTVDVQRAERVGVPITAIILLATFGSLAAATLPLALGILSVTITGAVIFFVAQVLPMSVFVTSAASMIGIGVAIDYSLFVLARYRQEVAAGHDEDAARSRALATSGLAVVFSGATVVIALVSIFLFRSTTLRSMALGAIVVVALSVLAAVTLLPALLSFMGRRAYAPGRIARYKERVARTRHGGGGGEFWSRWTDRVMRRPLVSAVAATSILLVLTIPAFSMKLGEEALSQFSPDHETRVGARLAADIVGPGTLESIRAVVAFDRGDARAARNRRALDAYVARVEADRAVAYVSAPRLSQDATKATVSIVPRTFSERPESQALLERLRTGAGTSPVAAVGAVSFGGDFALVEDFRAEVEDRAPGVFLLLVALTYLIMLLMMRSVVLPLKAIVMNVLTLGAASGVTVAIFQWGWLDGPLGYTSPGYVDAVVIPLMMAVVFGLSMDYEVFMLSRIREAFLAHGDNRRSVAQGLRESAGTISSAALIMVSVFLAFAAVSLASIKEIGAALAVAIALDATLVRLVLVPATMGLMGRWNWWLPRRLQWLPRFGFHAEPVPVSVPEPGVAPPTASEQEREPVGAAPSRG